MNKKNEMRAMPFLLTLLLLAMMIMPIIPTTVMAAEAPVELGTAAEFAVLAGSTVTNTGSTVVGGEAGGNVGVSTGTSITGFPPGVINNGTTHENDALAIQAQTDLTTAYNDAAARTSTTDLSGTDLGGLTLTPGVYSFTSEAELTGMLTLDGQGDPDAAFIFQIGSTLTTAEDSTINLINDAVFCRVFWQVGSSATLGTESEFTGHILAQVSITATTGATVQGQLLAQDGAVTLDSNVITNGFCTTTLHVIKQVINDDGRTAVASDFNVTVKTSLGIDVNGSPAAGAVSPGTTYTLAPGTYVVSEEAFEGYIASYSGDSNADGVVTLAAGEEKTVTITNNDMPVAPATATLHVIKQVINDDGRTAVASDFIVHVKISGNHVSGSPVFGTGSPGTTYTLVPGTYTVGEEVSELYTVSYSGDSDADGVVTLAAGEDKTVTITNNDIPIAPTPTPTPSIATLLVIKNVINDDGRTATASDFNVHVRTSSGNDVDRSPAPGSESPGTYYVLPPGTYNVSEDASEWYTSSYSGDSDADGNITLAVGDVKTVIITNNDIPSTPTPTTATLHVIKQVINDDGRMANASDFSVNVKTSSGDDVAGSPAYGAESPGVTYTLAPGTYVVSEGDYDWYTASYSGDSDADGIVTLAAGEEKTVTIINNDIPSNPQTGNFFIDSWTGFWAAIAGGLLILFGIYLYLRNQRRGTSNR